MARAKTLNLKNVESNIERGIETADAERAKSLEHLQLVRSAKTKSLNREHDRLSAKYGDKHRCRQRAHARDRRALNPPVLVV